MLFSAARGVCRSAVSSPITLSSRLLARNTIQCRSLHNLPALARQTTYEKAGIPGLYSKDGFRDVWTEYQQYVVDELSRQTAETEHETRTPFGIMLNTAEHMLDTPIFNFASQAHNNHLFVEALRPSVAEDGQLLENPTKPNPALLAAIEKSFGSLENLREDVIACATDPLYLGAGWLFLVEDYQKSIHLQYSFQAGSPYFPGKTQVFDLNVPVTDEVNQQLEDIKADVEEKANAYSMPLIAINFWEVAYLKDYGIAGRGAFAAKVWDSLDWDVINKRYFGN